MFTQFGLNEQLLKALTKLKLENPTPVQDALIPVALQGKDIQASAETGSGKTAAFLLPIFHQMLEQPSPNSATRVLILLPTRELSMQVDKHARDMAAFTGISTAVIVGGSSFKEQKASIRKNPEVIIGTPGRILEHVQKKSLDLSELEFLVLDEADRMLDMGFREEVMEIVTSCASKRQTFLLSATLVHEGLGRIAHVVLQEPEIVALGTHRQKHENIAQQIILADEPRHKNQLVSWLLANETYEKVLIFTNTKINAEALAGVLQKQHRVACLHGDMQQDARKQVMHWFRTGVIKILVATDLAARGLDIKGVNLVINYGMARSGDDYVHRIGRTGRAGEKGLAISLISPQEWNPMSSIERYLGLDFEQRKIPGLEARFKGPNLKNAKAARKKSKPKKQEKVIPKAQQRHSYKKNIGKRRKPSEKHPVADSPWESSQSSAPGKADKTSGKSAGKEQAKESRGGRLQPVVQKKAVKNVDSAGLSPLKKK